MVSCLWNTCTLSHTLCGREYCEQRLTTEIIQWAILSWRYVSMGVLVLTLAHIAVSVAIHKVEFGVLLFWDTVYMLLFMLHWLTNDRGVVFGRLSVCVSIFATIATLCKSCRNTVKIHGHWCWYLAAKFTRWQHLSPSTCYQVTAPFTRWQHLSLGGSTCHQVAAPVTRWQHLSPISCHQMAASVTRWQHLQRDAGEAFLYLTLVVCFFYFVFFVVSVNGLFNAGQVVVSNDYIWNCVVQVYCATETCESLLVCFV